MKLRTVAACALVFCAALVVTASAAATTATLRVVGKGNVVLAEQQVKSSDVTVKTSPKATCLGAGTGGSGKPVALKGNTALGLLADGAKTIKRLAPLSLTDHFSFGLALCGVGKSVAKGKSSWYLKINHKGAMVGGEKAKIKSGDEVLWDLAPSYPYPEELVLSAPREASAGVPFAVHVYAYDEKGRRKPMKGATVTGATGPTDASGKVMVTLTEPTLLSAAIGDAIPSAQEPVCLGSECPAGS
ncbi:MAG TPA: hypothetical protein VHA80_07045 [Solirubrobacterales bacterium]|nr:hypothetical protein [Solirubrobacterales bacterium]